MTAPADSADAIVLVYLTRSGALGPEMLVEDAPGEALGYRLPATPLRAGEHPCEAADRLVTKLVAAATGGVPVSFAYRKVAGAPRHTFVTAADSALPDRIGACRWVAFADGLPWG